MKTKKVNKIGWSNKIKTMVIVTVLMLLVTSVLVVAYQTPVFSKPGTLAPLSAGEPITSIHIGGNNDTTMREYYNEGEDTNETTCSTTEWYQSFTIGTVGPYQNFLLSHIKIKLDDVPLGAEDVDFRIYEFTWDPEAPYARLMAQEEITFNNLSDGWNTISFLSHELILNKSRGYAIGIFAVAVPDALILMDESSPTYAGGKVYKKTMMPPRYTERSPEADMMFEVWGYSTSGILILGNVHWGGR